VKKLKETLVAVQQLDKNMGSLRIWLAHMESELAKPIVYDSCNSEEIQKKLSEQQVGWRLLCHAAHVLLARKLGGCKTSTQGEKSRGN